MIEEDTIMVSVYVSLIRKKLKTLEEVPMEIRAKVEEALKYEA